MNKETIVKALREDIVNVTFTKVDGSRRVMRCTLIPHFLPPDDRQAVKESRPVNEDLIVAFDLDKRAFRSFKVGNVIEWSVNER